MAKQKQSGRLAVLSTHEDLGPRGVGRAKRVRDPERGDVVLVTLDGAAVGSAKARRYFKRHVEAVMALRHPGLVPILDAGTDDGEGRAFLLEELALGRTLRQVLAAGPLPSHHALGIAVDLLNALAHAHHRGVVHGGLTPDSVLVQDGPTGPRGRILDLGFLRVVADEQESPVGPVRVDADYAAPEMIKGEATDGRADVYSVGLLLQEMLTGKHPIPAAPKNRLLTRLNDSAADLPPKTIADPALDEAVRAALRAALHKNAARRWATARAFALALRPGAAPAAETAPVVAPEGGACAACPIHVKPAAQRTWSRHESDQPFRCPTCQGVFCGKTHWDARALCCKKCHERPVLLSNAPAPEDVAPTFTPAAPPEPAAAASPAADKGKSVVDARRDALRDLLERSSAEGWRTTSAATPSVEPPKPAAAKAEPAKADPAKADPAKLEPVKAVEAKRAEAAPPPAEPARPADAPRSEATRRASTVRVESEGRNNALAEVWADEKNRQLEAKQRTGATPRPAVTAAAAAPAPIAVRAADTTGWRLLTAGLGLVLVFVIAAWQSDRTADRAALAEAKKAADAKAAAAATLAERRQDEVRTLTKQRGELEGKLDHLRSAEGALRREIAQLGAGRADALKEKHAVEAQLAEAERVRAALARERAELEARATAAATDLDALGRERAALVGRLEAATAGRQELEQRLRAVEAEQAALDAERTQLSTRLQTVGQSLDAARAQREDLELRLRRALVRVQDQALDLDDLQLQLLAAARSQEGLAAEKRTLEARLAEAHELLKAQEAPVVLEAIGGGPATLAPATTAEVASRALLRAPQPALRTVLDAAAEERALATVQVVLDAPLGFEARVSARTADGPIPADGWRILTSAASTTEPLLRAWLSPADAAALLGDHESLIVLIEPVAGAAGEPRLVLGARLVVTPLGDDVAARLRAR